MRRRCALALLLTLACGGDCDPIGDAEARPGRDRGRRGASRVAAFERENPAACDIVAVLGQSLGNGVCSGGTCTALTTSDGVDAILNVGDNALCPDREGGACGPWSNLEAPITSLIRQWRSMRGGVPPAVPQIIGLRDAVSGSAINTWNEGDANYLEAVGDVSAAVGLLSAGTTGCTEAVVRAVYWVHGEADDDTTDNDYDGQLDAIITAYCADVRAITGQAACPLWVLDQTSSWTSEAQADAEIAGQLYNVCSSRADTICVTPKYAETYETNSPYLHLQAAGYRHLGAIVGREIYRAIDLGQVMEGLHVSSAAASGTTITACFDAPRGSVEVDTTTCNAKTLRGWSYTQDEVNAPSITGVAAVSGDCVAITMSAAPQDYSSARLKLGWTGVASTAGNGCAITGAETNKPYSNYRTTADVALWYDSGAPTFVWALHQSVAITGGGAAPASIATHYFSPDVSSEYVLFPDNASDDYTTAATITFWERHSSSTNNVVVIDKALGGGFAWSVRTVVSGANESLRFMLNGAANYETSTADAYDSDGVWHNWVFVYDGSGTPSARIYKDCARSDGTNGGTIPASLTNSTQGVEVNGSVGTTSDLAWAAGWGTAATEAQIHEICRAPVDLAATTLGTPTFWVRPDADDAIGAGNVTDHGSPANAATCTGCEADDLATGALP